MIPIYFALIVNCISVVVALIVGIRIGRDQCRKDYGHG